jgi:hypothetical protein
MTLKNLTKGQATALALLRSRLDPRNPMFSADTVVRDALTSIRPYLDSWVLPLIEFAAEGEQWHGQAEGIARDYAQRREAVRKATATRLPGLTDGPINPLGYKVMGDPTPSAPVWMVDCVTRSNAGGKLYNAVRIDNGTECSHEPTHDYAAALRRVDSLNFKAAAKVQS